MYQSMLNRYEKSITKRLLNRGNRSILLFGEDYFTSCIEKELLKCCPVVEKYDVSKKYSKEEYFALIACYGGHKDYVDMMHNLGFEYKVDFETMNIGGWCEPLDCIDSLLGYGRENAYTIIGDESKTKIVIYGNSSSDIGVAGIKNWIEYLDDYLREHGLKTQIWGGGVAGYHSGQELLKCIRDINIINPTIIISMTGINDVEGFSTRMEKTSLLHKYQNRMWNYILENQGVPDSIDMRNIKKVSNGLVQVEGNAEVFINNARKMNAICNEYRVKFLTVLQPMIGYSCVEKELDVLLEKAGIKEALYNNTERFSKSVSMHLERELWYKDMSQLFLLEENCFFDWCHYSEKGSKILGNIIGEYVVKILS